MPMTVKGDIETKTGSFTWKIENCFDDCSNVGDGYTSPNFSIQCVDQTTKWYSNVYPLGRNESCKDYVSLSIFYKGDSEVMMNYQISVVSRRKKFSKSVKDQIFHAGKGWRWDEFAKHEDLKNTKNGALIDDTLTILFEITFSQTVEDDGDVYKVYKKTGGVINELEDYEKLLEVNYFSDVTFDIKGEKMYLHKAILMCRNPVFKAMFEHDMKENKQSSVDITDIDYEVMREFFRFIYSGKVKNIEKIAKLLLMAADKYDATELKALCEETLYDVLSIDNAIEYLKFTEICNTIHLKKLVIKFVIDNLKDIVRKSNFKLLFAEVDRDVVCEIMEAMADKN